MHNNWHFLARLREGGSWLPALYHLCLSVIGALALLLVDCPATSASDNLNRLADTLLNITDRTNHGGRSAYGSSAAEALHLQCSVHDNEEACNRLIISSRKPGFASNWSTAVAYVSRGEFKEARNDLRGALDDYVDARRRYDKFPKLDLTIARVEKALYEKDAQAAKVTADRERAEKEAFYRVDEASWHKAIGDAPVETPKPERLAEHKAPSTHIPSQSIVTGALPSTNHSSKSPPSRSGIRQPASARNGARSVDVSPTRDPAKVALAPISFPSDRKSFSPSSNWSAWWFYLAAAGFLISVHIAYMLYRGVGLQGDYGLASPSGNADHQPIFPRSIVRPEGIGNRDAIGIGDLDPAPATEAVANFEQDDGGSGALLAEKPKPPPLPEQIDSIAETATPEPVTPSEGPVQERVAESSDATGAIVTPSRPPPLPGQGNSTDDATVPELITQPDQSVPEELTEALNEVDAVVETLGPPALVEQLNSIEETSSELIAQLDAPVLEELTEALKETWVVIEASETLPLPGDVNPTDEAAMPDDLGLEELTEALKETWAVFEASEPPPLSGDISPVDEALLSELVPLPDGPPPEELVEASNETGTGTEVTEPPPLLGDIRPVDEALLSELVPLPDGPPSEELAVEPNEIETGIEVTEPPPLLGDINPVDEAALPELATLLDGSPPEELIEASNEIGAEREEFEVPELLEQDNSIDEMAMLEWAALPDDSIPEELYEAPTEAVAVVEELELTPLPEQDDSNDDTAMITLPEAPTTERMLDPKSVDINDQRTSLVPPFDDEIAGFSLQEERTSGLAFARLNAQTGADLFSDFSRTHILEELRSGLAVCDDADKHLSVSSDAGPITHVIAMSVCAGVFQCWEGSPPSDDLKLRLYEVSRLLAATEFLGEVDRQGQRHPVFCDLVGDRRQVIATWSHVLVDIWKGLLSCIPNCDQLEANSLPMEELAPTTLEELEKPFLVPITLMKALHQSATVEAGYLCDVRLMMVDNINRLETEHGLQGYEVFQWLTGDTEPLHEHAVILAGEIIHNTEFVHFFRSTPASTIDIAELEEHYSVVVGDDAARRSALLSDVLAPRFEEVLKDELSMLIIDSHGRLNRSIEREVFDGKHPDLELRYVAIDIASPTNSGLFNPFRIDLTNSDALIRERLLNEAFEIECFVFDALLGSEVTQSHLSDLRHLMRLLHAVPGANLGTLLRLSDPLTFSEFKKFTSQIGNSSSRKFFSDGSNRQSFSNLMHHIHKNLGELLLDPTFSEAMTGTLSANHVVGKTGIGKIVLLNTGAADISATGMEVLKRAFVANTVLENIQNKASPSSNQSLLFCVDDALACFGGNLSELEAMLDHVKKLEGTIFLGHGNSADL